MSHAGVSTWSEGVRAPLPAPEKARRALDDARRQRAEYLVAVADGLLTPFDVIEAAALETGRALRRIPLRDLLASQEGWGDQRANRLLSAVADRIGLAAEDVRKQTIAWLIDPRAGGRRVMVWHEVQFDKGALPWSGFPYFPAGKVE